MSNVPWGLVTPATLTLAMALGGAAAPAAIVVAVEAEETDGSVLEALTASSYGAIWEYCWAVWPVG
ncbi:MAG TPA: hypothetical protein VKF15_05295 [Nitrososphaerales archaeon]|nr:hypothetical protein [Nitrososphaerales archaeon]